MCVLLHASYMERRTLHRNPRKLADDVGWNDTKIIRPSTAKAITLLNVFSCQPAKNVMRIFNP